jgi:hypothetical protein
MKRGFKDPRGKHVRMYNELLYSPAFIALSWSAQAIYLYMRGQLGSTNNGDISASLSLFKTYGISSSATLSNALFELQTLGFIEKTRQGGITSGGKNCCLYRFTDEDSYDIPKKQITAQKATFDYREFKTVEQAKAALSKNKVKVQKMNRIGSKNESEAQFSDSKNEHESV